MGCNCKTKKSVDSSSNDENKPKLNIISNVIHYSIKLIGFTIALALLPIIILMIVYYMFKLIVLTKDIDIKPLFVSVSKFMKKVAKDNADEDDDEDDDDNDEAEWEEANSDEFVLVGVDDITNKDSK